jgi:hypothetical protein
MAVELLSAPALLMSMTEIAELARVQRPVVTTWRRRHRDFPAPTGGDAAQPLFEPRQVADWLISTGRADRDQIEPELSLYTLTGLAGQYPGMDLVVAVTALICLRYLTDENEPLADGSDDDLAVLREQASAIDPNDLLLVSEVYGIPPTARWLAALVDELIEAAWGCRQAFERIMAARNRFQIGALSASAMSPALARLIAELSGARELVRRTDSLIVTDPATGAGDLLAAIAHVLGPDCAPMFTGAEADPVLARLVRRRLIVHDVPVADMDIRVGAELPDESGDPDVIVTQIPYRPCEDRDVVAVLDSVGDVAVRMTAGRFAVVLGPAAALADDLPSFSSAARTRADLLKGDMVEAIVRLPGGLMPFRPGYETALWVLTQARHSRWRGRVLLADVSDRPLTADVVRDLAEDIITWRRDGYLPQAHRRAFSVQAEVGSLVDPPRPLMTGRRPGSQRERKSDANERVTLITRYGAELDRFGATATADRGHIGTEALAGADRQPTTEAIGALVRQRRLVMRKGIRLAPADVGGSGKHVVLGAEEVLGFRRLGERRVDLEVFANRYPNARLTEPGDVLVTMNPRPGAIIDHDGYAIAEYPVRIIRIPGTEAEQFTPRVLATLLFAGGSGRRPAGAVRTVNSLKEQRVPLLPVSEVRHLDVLFASIDARRALAQREIDMLDELCHVATGGLIDGTLALVSNYK